MTNKEKLAEIESINIKSTIIDEENKRVEEALKPISERLENIKKNENLDIKDLEKISDLEKQISSQLNKLKISTIKNNNNKQRLKSLANETKIIIEQNEISKHYKKLKTKHEITKYLFLFITLFVPFIVILYLFSHENIQENLSASYYISLSPLLFIEIILYKTYLYHNNLAEHYEHRESVAISIVKVSETYFGGYKTLNKLEDRDRFRDFGLKIYEELYKPIKKEKANDKELIKVIRDLIRKIDTK